MPKLPRLVPKPQPPKPSGECKHEVDRVEEIKIVKGKLITVRICIKCGKRTN